MTPTQHEIDSLASFVEAIDELQNEPFFAKDEPRSASKSGKRYTFTLGDRCHFRSALITFRRIWMESDTENFFKVCKVVKRHDQKLRAIIDTTQKYVQSTMKEEAGFFVRLPGVTNEQHINLWLNAVFAHSGLKDKNSPLRHNFDELVKAHGLGIMEFAFRTAVFRLGIFYFQAAQLAIRPLHLIWQAKGLLPSFNMGSAFGKARREKMEDGSVIIRQSASEHFTEETMEQRFIRILGRDGYNGLKAVIGRLSVSDKVKIRMALKHTSIRSLLEESGVALVVGTEVPDYKNIKGALTFSSLPGLRSTRWSGIVCTEDDVITDVEGESVLNSQLQSFREELLA